MKQFDVKYSWTENRHRAFVAVKKLLSEGEDTLLVYYNPDFLIKLYCDVSNEGTVDVIVHGFGQTIRIYYGIHKFNSYLQGRHFKIMKDHKHLTNESL